MPAHARRLKRPIVYAISARCRPRFSDAAILEMTMAQAVHRFSAGFRRRLRRNLFRLNIADFYLAAPGRDMMPVD